MKKILLAGSLASLLLLAACADTEEAPEQAEQETTDTAELEERIEELESENEALKTENEELTANANESTEENSEDTDVEEQAEDVGVEGEDIKFIASSFEESFDSLDVKLLDGGVSRINVPEEDVWLFDEEIEPGEHDIIALEFEINNTVDEPRDFYFNFATIVTNTNQQIESQSFLSSDLENEFLGEVTSTGAVIWLLEPGTAEDIEWIDIQVPTVSDGETYDTLTETETVRVEFK